MSGPSGELLPGSRSDERAEHTVAFAADPAKDVGAGPGTGVADGPYEPGRGSGEGAADAQRVAHVVDLE